MHILFHTPREDDAISFYRSGGVLQDLHRLYGVGVTTLREKALVQKHFNWTTFNNVDLLYLHRPYGDNERELLELSHACGVPVWIDYDDALPEVDQHNPAYETYGAKFQDTWEYFTTNADVLTVSTQDLKDYIGREDAVVSKNTFPTRYMDMWAGERPVPTKKLWWRGGLSHRIDWFTYRKPMADMDVKDFTLYMCGNIPPRVLKTVRHESVDTMSVVKYFTTVREHAPGVALAPLVDNVFNRCKSDIAWLENTILCNGVTVGPSLPEWDKPGVYSYTGPEDFEDAVHRAMDNYDKDHGALDYILKHRCPRKRAARLMEELDGTV